MRARSLALLSLGRLARSARAGWLHRLRNAGVVLLVALAGCESLWGAFVDPNAGNCVVTPGLCAPGTVCSERTKRCEPIGGGGDEPDGGPSVSDGGGDLARNTVFPPPLPSCQRGGFCLHTPLTTSTLRGVVAFTGPIVWAAGGDVILRFEAGRWSRMNDAGGYVDLVDLVGRASTLDGFALSRTGALYSFDSKRVIRIAGSLPDPSKTVERMFALDANNIWAVGPGGAIWFWNGSSWTAEASPTSRNLHGVFGLSADAVWAVGDNATMLRRTSSGGWVTVTGLVSALNLNSVWAASPSMVFAVGDGGLIAVHDGARWVTETSGLTANLTAVTGDTNTVFAVAQNGTVLTRIASATWTQAALTSRGLFGASALGSDLYVVGAQGLRAARQAGAWSQSEADALPRPSAVVALPDASGKYLAVGVLQAARNLAEWNPTGGLWTSSGATGAMTLRGLSIRSATDAFAVGDSGACARLGAAGWSPCATTAGSSNLTAVWMDPAQMTNGWLVGAAGTVQRWNGSSWNSVVSSTTADLFGVRGDATGDAWAVGQGGVILRCTSTCVQEAKPAGTPTLRAVWVTPLNEVFAVGDGGTLLRRVATATPPWQKVTSPTTSALYAIWGTGTMVQQLFAVGERGTVLRSLDGTTWTALSSDVTLDLTGIGGIDPNNIWAVGPDAGWLRFVP